MLIDQSMGPLNLPRLPRKTKTQHKKVAVAESLPCVSQCLCG
jgi:hypothetical protein